MGRFAKFIALGNALRSLTYWGYLLVAGIGVFGAGISWATVSYLWVAAPPVAKGLIVVGGGLMFVAAAALVSERWRKRPRLEHKVVGPAVLARRSLEEDVRHIMDYGVLHLVTSWSGDKDRIDRIEAQINEVLALSAEVGGRFKDKAQRAFMAWNGYADAMNARTQGKDLYSDADVVARLFGAIDTLKEIHPRDASEPPVPTLTEVTHQRLQGSQSEGPAQPLP